MINKTTYYMPRDGHKAKTTVKGGGLRRKESLTSTNMVNAQYSLFSYEEIKKIFHAWYSLLYSIITTYCIFNKLF